MSVTAGAVSRPSAANPPPLWLWIGATVGAALLAAALAAAPILLLVGVVATVAASVFVVAFVQPRWLLVLELAFVIGYVPIVLSEQFGVPITHQTIVLLLVFSIAVRRLLGTEHHALPRVAWLLAALVAATAASIVLAYDKALASTELFELVEVVIFAVCVIMLIDDTAWLRRALWAVVGVGGVLGALTSFQQLAGLYDNTFFGFSVVDRSDVLLLRSGGPIHPVYFGQTMVAIAALALYLGLASRKVSVRVLAFSASLACLGGMYFSHSRGALLAVLVAGAVAALLRRVSIWFVAAGAAAVVLSALLLVPAEERGRLLEVVRPGESGIAHASDASLANRFAENVAAAAMFRDHPLIGVGAGNYPALYLDYAQYIGLDSRAEERTGVAQAPHNLYLEALAELGVLGALAFFGVIAAAFLGTWRARARLPGRDALLGEGIFVALAGFFTASLFLHLAYQHYLWLMLALGLAAGEVARRTAASA